MVDPLPVALTAAGVELALLPALANRHGLITGATGTGKTVTLQVLAERFSRIGVPTFMADVKGDLSGLAAAGEPGASKGVGVYFVTQHPRDIPETVLGQLGNRVQHALRAFTPKDRKAVRAAAQTLRENPAIDAEQAITELGVGEALVSFLDAHGAPGVVERAWILPPASRIGPATAAERRAAIAASVVRGHYETTVDRESAYEKIAARTTARQPEAGAAPAGGKAMNDLLFGSTGPRGGRREGLIESAARSAARSVGSGLGRQIMRGLLGSIFGGRQRWRGV
jgi:hypothetical protein